MAAIRPHSASSPTNGEDKPLLLPSSPKLGVSLKEWLTASGLAQYHDKLVAQGYDDMELLLSLKNGELGSMMDAIAALPGHRVRFEKKLGELREQQAGR